MFDLVKWINRKAGKWIGIEKMHVSVQIISQFTYLHLFPVMFMSFTHSRGSQQGFIQLQQITSAGEHLLNTGHILFYFVLFSTGCSCEKGVKTPEM